MVYMGLTLGGQNSVVAYLELPMKRLYNVMCYLGLLLWVQYNMMAYLALPLGDNTV